MFRHTLEMLTRFYTFFRSAKMTIIIITALVLLYFLGLIIPQKTLIPSAEAYAEWKAAYPVFSTVVEFLGLNEIFLAPLTIVCLALFFTNLVVVMAHRFPVILRRMYLIRPARGENTAIPSLSSDARTFEVTAGSAAAGTAVGAFLRKRLWTFVGGDGVRTFLAVRNRYSPAGFLFFHASFLLCLVGGLFVMYTRFAGTLILTEGQEFIPDLKAFRHISRDPKIMKELPSFFLRIDRVAPQYERDVSTDLDVDVLFTYKGDEQRTRLKVNEPLSQEALTILARDVGVSPLMVLRDRQGREISGAYFSLNVMKGETDSFEFPEAPYVFSLRFYPDYIDRDGEPGTRSRALANPVMQLAIKNREGETVFDGLLPLKQRVSFDGMTLAFEDVRHWVEFFVVREYGNYPLFAGFFLGVLGLLMRLLFYQKTLVITIADAIGGSRITIDGKSEYYPHSFRSELDALAAGLRDFIEREAA